MSSLLIRESCTAFKQKVVAVLLVLALSACGGSVPPSVPERPEKWPANPLISQQHPWESKILEMYGTVIADSSSGSFKAWYLCTGAEDIHRICYAESSDGITWRKPLVGLMINGEPTNVVIDGGHGISVLRDDQAPPEQRYKAVGGYIKAVSRDGISWTVTPWTGAGLRNDTATSLVKWRGKYLAFVRSQVPDPSWPNIMRGVGLTTSDDFETWTEKKTVLTTDAVDGYPYAQVYSLSVSPLGDRLVGLLSLIHLDVVQGNNSLGYRDVQLVTSLDGESWQRGSREVFLQPTPGSWDSGQVWPSTTMFERNGVVWIYYSGAPNRHGEDWRNPAIGLATITRSGLEALLR